MTHVISRIKVMSNLNIVERRHSQDGRVTIQHLNRPRDLRIATFPTALGEKIVVRIHECLSETLAFDHLGMSVAQAEKLTNLIANRTARCSSPDRWARARPRPCTVAWAR